jgi:hypothetical protein
MRKQTIARRKGKIKKKKPSSGSRERLIFAVLFLPFDYIVALLANPLDRSS